MCLTVQQDHGIAVEGEIVMPCLGAAGHVGTEHPE